MPNWSVQNITNWSVTQVILYSPFKVLIKSTQSFRLSVRLSAITFVSFLGLKLYTLPLYNNNPLLVLTGCLTFSPIVFRSECPKNPKG